MTRQSPTANRFRKARAFWSDLDERLGKLGRGLQVTRMFMERYEGI